MTAPLNRMNRNRMHAQHSREGFLAQTPEAGDAIRVIDPNHELTGTTAASRLSLQSIHPFI